MAGVTFALTGVKELNRAIENGQKELKKKRVALLTKVANEVRDEIRSRAPQGPTGNLKRACYSNVVGANSDYPLAFAGVREGRGFAPHAHLVEYGTSGTRVPKKKSILMSKGGQFFGRVVAPMPAHPFFRLAWDSKQDKVKGEIIEGLKVTILGDYKS